MRAGDEDGFRESFDHERERGGGVLHRVCAMDDQEAIIEAVVLFESFEDEDEERKLKDKVPAVIITLDNIAYWDFQDSEYQIKNGKEKKNFLGL